MKIIFGDSHEEDRDALSDCRFVIEAMEDNEFTNDEPVSEWSSAENAFYAYDCAESETGLEIVGAFIKGADPYPLLDDWGAKIMDHDYPGEEIVFDLQYVYGSERFTGWITKLGDNEYRAFIGTRDGILDRRKLTKSEYITFTDTMDDLFNGWPEYNFNSIFTMRLFVFYGDFAHMKEEHLRELDRRRWL